MQDKGAAPYLRPQPHTLDKVPVRYAMCLTLPTVASGPVSYSLDEFCEELQHRSLHATMSLLEDEDKPYIHSHCATHFQEEATIKSLELLKYESWDEWRHELTILTINYEGQDYLIHINRAWAAPKGWREYVPFPTWGSQKPSNDEIMVYLPGEEEEAARRDTKLVARCDLKDVRLWLANFILMKLKTEHPKYSLFGVNCWAWSRSIACLLITESSQTSNIFILDGPSPASTYDLLKFLRSDGPWVRLVLRAHPNDPQPQHLPGLFPRTRLFMKYLLYGSKVYSHTTETVVSTRPGKAIHFIRWRKVTVTPELVLDGNSGEALSENWIPHSCQDTGYAQDVAAKPIPNSLSTAGNFLYLLTSPIHIPKGSHVTSIRVLTNMVTPNSKDSASWIKCGLVRTVGESNEALQLVGQKSRPRMIKGLGGLGQEFLLNSGLVESFQNGNMIGVWAMGPPSEGVPRPWIMEIESIKVVVGFEEDFEEARPTRLTELILNSLWTSHANWQAPLVKLRDNLVPRLKAAFWHDRIEFGRIKLALHTYSGTFDAGYNDRTSMGLPHLFDSARLATDIKHSAYSNSLCGPGELLYLLTSPIRFPPNNQVLSVTVYTWSFQGRIHQKYGRFPNLKPWASWEVGVVRPNPALKELKLKGQRQEISRSTYATDLQPRRNEYQFKRQHELVQRIENGDMVGVWARVRDPCSYSEIRKALVVVKIGPRPGLQPSLGRRVFDQVLGQTANTNVPRWAQQARVGLRVGLLVGVILVTIPGQWREDDDMALPI